ncbi:MAG: lipid-A-disaccharide synthase [Chitinispirillaceae bacterium]|nr:lipid-A-disaccharide synthase [Chitinispirillaceae bacterium]
MATPSLMFIAGDPSGDQHTAAVVERVRQSHPDAECWGIGGPAMQRAGFLPVMPFEQFNRMGFLEVIGHLPFFFAAKKTLVRLLAKRKPQALVCVDYSGFNIPMMKAAARRGVPVVWYIAPMVWAWNRKRAAVLCRHAAHIAVIFPFETACFSSRQTSVTFVGNPTVEAMERHGLFSRLPRTPSPGSSLHLVIVPGSRRQEIEHMLPRMIGAAAILQERFGPFRVTVSQYGTLPTQIYKNHIGARPIALHSGPLRDLLVQADLALVTSGTATLETALIGIPFIIAYHTSVITYTIARRLVRIPHVGLPNIIAGEIIVPECIQEQADPQNLALTLGRFIESPRLYENTVKRLTALRHELGRKRPSEEVSRIIMKTIGLPDSH